MIIAQIACNILGGILIFNFPNIHNMNKTAKIIRANFNSAPQINKNIAIIALL